MILRPIGTEGGIVKRSGMYLLLDAPVCIWSSNFGENVH